MLSAIHPSHILAFLDSYSVLTQPRKICAMSETPARDSSLPIFWRERDSAGLLKNEASFPTSLQGQAMPWVLMGSPDPQTQQ